MLRELRYYAIKSIKVLNYYNIDIVLKHYGGRNTSIWVLTSFVFLTSFRFMSSFVFLSFFVGLTSLHFELFWCLMLFVLFCCLTSLVLYTFKKMCAIIDLFLSELFRPFLLLLSSSFCLYVLWFMELFQILLWHHFRTLILIGRTPWGEGVVLKLLQ